MPKRKPAVSVDDLYGQIKVLKQQMAEIEREREQIEVLPEEEKPPEDSADESEDQEDDKVSTQDDALDDKNEKVDESDKENNKGLDDLDENELQKDQTKTLNDEILNALGIDPTDDNAKRIQIHPDILKRWKHWFFKGMKAEEQEALLKKYRALEGLEPPILNPEVSAVLTETALKRDSYAIERQKLATAALAALGSAINDLIEAEEGIDGTNLIEKLNEAAKLINHIIFSLSESRKAFILPGIEKQKKNVLTNAQTDEFLFGKNLKDRIKEAKVIEKAGQDVKAINTKPLQVKNNLNWMGLQPRKPAYGRAGYGNQPGGKPRMRVFFKNRQQPFNSKVQNQNRFRPPGKPPAEKPK